MTATRLLTGEDQPLSNLEFVYWNAYFVRKGEIEAEANKPKKTQGPATQQFKKTMGNKD